MPEGAWVGILGVVIGVIVAIVGYLVASYIRYCFLKPELTIGKDEPQEGESFVRHSIRITNNGRTAAKNCNVIASIGNIKKENVIAEPITHSYITTDYFRAIKDESLCWSFQVANPVPNSEQKAINPAFLSIFPGSTRLTELCVVNRESVEMRIPYEMGWEIIRVVLDGKKVYDVELKVFAENVRYDPKKHRARFKLVPNTQKKDIVVERLDC